ncbi:MAG: NfeD family protein [Erysipelotrichales bacterium]|nr:NfeD family protein [Erysipelotrichales bacterium]
MLTMLANINVIGVIVWVVVFVAAVVIEFSTMELVSIWFAISAIPSLIMAAFGVNIWYQILVFAVMSAIAFVITKLFIKKKIKVNPSATNADSLIGNEILIINDVTPTQNGEGKVRDIVWTVTSKDFIAKGEFAIVKEIKGNRLIVIKKEIK